MSLSEKGRAKSTNRKCACVISKTTVCICEGASLVCMPVLTKAPTSRAAEGCLFPKTLRAPGQPVPLLPAAQKQLPCQGSGASANRPSSWSSAWITNGWDKQRGVFKGSLSVWGGGELGSPKDLSRINFSCQLFLLNKDLYI